MKERVLKVIDRNIVSWESLRDSTSGSYRVPYAMTVGALKELRMEIVSIPEESDGPQAD